MFSHSNHTYATSQHPACLREEFDILRKGSLIVRPSDSWVLLHTILLFNFIFCYDFVEKFQLLFQYICL